MLRSRRERLRPADVGLVAGGRRRVHGLRREEVAALAAISPTYYAFIEQGRPVRPTRQVLDALAAALRLDPAERLHLHELVHGTPGPDVDVIERLAPLVTELVDRLDPAPAYVTGQWWDVLAANRAARALWADWAAMEPADRNMLWWTFSDPAARAVFAEWEQEASSLLARFRSAAARHPGDRAFGDLIDRLHMASPEVRAWWPRHDIAALSPGTKRLRHPALGELELRYVVLQVANNPEQKLVIFSVGEADAARLAKLIGGMNPRPDQDRHLSRTAGPRRPAADR